MEEVWPVFCQVQRVVSKIDESLNMDEIQKTLKTLEWIQSRIAIEGVFSPNETLIDLSTSQLNYLLVDYYTGVLMQQVQAPKDFNERIAILEKSQACLSAFLDRLEQYTLLSTKERLQQMEFVEEKTNAEQLRAVKIERFRRNRDAQKRLDDLVNMQSRSTGEDNEELERERVLGVLELAVFRTFEEQLGMSKELEMLREMVKMNEQRGKMKSSIEEDPLSSPIRQGQGIEVTHIDSTMEMRKETIRGQVFQPGHRLPTMSLQEFADQELADAKAREEREANAPKGPRRIEQLEEDGDEDNAKLVEEAVYRDRNWDDWKDANPKGSGNKGWTQF